MDGYEFSLKEIRTAQAFVDQAVSALEKASGKKEADQEDVRKSALKALDYYHEGEGGVFQRMAEIGQ